MTVLADAPAVRTVKLNFDIIEKSAPDAEDHFIAGFASVSYEADGAPVVDLDGDFVPLSELRKAMHAYFRDFAVGGEMHEGDAPNQAQEMVITDEAFQKALAHDCPNCGARIEKFARQGAYIRIGCGSELVRKVRAGGRLQFSIEGKAVRQEVTV